MIRHPDRHRSHGVHEPRGRPAAGRRHEGDGAGPESGRILREPRRIGVDEGFEVARVRRDQNAALVRRPMLEREHPRDRRAIPWIASDAVHGLGGIRDDPARRTVTARR